MVVMPSDHLISDCKNSLDSCNRLLVWCMKTAGLWSLLGSNPAIRNGFMYIQRGEKLDNRCDNAFRVRAFAEKPNAEVARQFYHSGEFLWNAVFLPGMQKPFSIISQS